MSTSTALRYPHLYPPPATPYLMLLLRSYALPRPFERLPQPLHQQELNQPYFGYWYTCQVKLTQLRRALKLFEDIEVCDARVTKERLACELQELQTYYLKLMEL